MKHFGRILVIGLGQFGSSVARNLVRFGSDVIALDTDERRVEALAREVPNVRQADATDLAVLSELRVDKLSLALNAIGDEFLEGSILTTALLRQLGAPRLIARATTDLHKRILLAIGADEIIEPEREIGAMVARRLARSGLVSQLDLGDNMTAVEITAPEAWIDLTLADLNLRRHRGITVVAIRRSGGGEWVPPDPEVPFRRGDVILALGKQTTIDVVLKETE